MQTVTANPATHRKPARMRRAYHVVPRLPLRFSPPQMTGTSTMMVGVQIAWLNNGESNEPVR